MKLFRMKADLRAHQAKHDHSLVLLIPQQQVKVMAQKLLDVLSAPVPSGASDLLIEMHGTLEQHFEEWRSVEGQPEATKTEDLAPLDSVSDDQDEDNDPDY